MLKKDVSVFCLHNVCVSFDSHNFILFYDMLYFVKAENVTSGSWYYFVLNNEKLGNLKETHDRTRNGGIKKKHTVE